MDEPHGVGRAERAGDGHGDAHDGREGESLLALEARVEIFPFEEVHRHVEEALVRAVIEDAHDRVAAGLAAMRASRAKRARAPAP